MAVYGFNNKNTAEKLNDLVGPTHGDGKVVSQKPRQSTNASMCIKNETGVDIPPYSTVFITNVYQDSRYNYVEVKSWNQIKDDDDLSKAKETPLVTGRDKIVKGSDTFRVPNRSGYFIAEVDGASVELGDKLGPYDQSSTEASMKLATDTEEELFVCVGTYDDSSILEGLDPSKDYALVTRLPAAPEAPPLTVLIGKVAQLNDFPFGRSGSGALQSYYNTAPGMVTVDGTKLDGQNNPSGTSRIQARYYGSFPLAVGAAVFCIKYQDKEPGGDWQDAWWIIDGSRYELRTTGPLGPTV